MPNDLRSENIDTFALFKKALKILFEEDTYLFSIKAKREAFSCRMAQHLYRYFGSEWYIDSSIYGSDLLIWDRQGNIALALFIAKDYVSPVLKEKARNFHLEQKSALTLALSLLEGKDYSLIYRFEKEFIDYLHIIPRAGYEERVLKRCLIKDDKDTDPTLFKTKRKKATSS